MGKKPVVAIVGLIWAGMALVGCENCKNCRNKFNATPAYPSKTATPAVPDGVASSNAVTPAVGGAAAKAETMPKAADVVGTQGFGTGSQPTSTPVSTPAPTGPTTQNSLRPNDDMRPMPGQRSGYRSG